jgi:hypothetical protein
VVYKPNPDSVAEFRILKNDYTAEYGRNAGGIISVVTKSGTNEIHGTAFDFARNTSFNANDFFNNKYGLPRNDLERNQFGGTVGGPLTIPHLIQGKDRFFFFVSYQGQLQSSALAYAGITTFTTSQIGGDFSHSGLNGGVNAKVACFLSGLNHNTGDLTRPDGTSCGTPAHPAFQADPTNAYNAIINPNSFDPVAKKILALGLIPATSNGVYSSVASSTDNSNELTGKLDFIITEKDRVSLTVGGYRENLLLPYGGAAVSGAAGVGAIIAGNANVPGFNDQTKNQKYFANITYNRFFTPMVLNELRFTAQRSYIGQYVPENIPANSSPTDLGILINPEVSIGIPSLFFTNSGLSLGSNQLGPTFFPDTTYQIGDVLSWVHGRHTWKFGASFSAFQDNLLYAFATSGSYSFGGSGSNSIGNEFADFLIGNPNAFYQGPSAPNNIRTKTTSFFAQDEWHVRNDLVFTLGLRYEYSTPKLDTLGRTDDIIVGHQSTVFPAAPVGLAFPGDPGAPRGLYFPDKTNFAPRVGFAWSPRNNAKTSIRGGFGIFYDVMNGRDNIDQNGAAPFASFAAFGWYSVPSFNGASPLQDPYGTAGVANPFPTPSRSQITNWIAQLGPFNAATDDAHRVTPYVYQYSLGVQREIAPNLIADVSYVGSTSWKLQAFRDFNPMILGTTNRALDVNQPNPTINSECALINPASSECPFAGPLSVYVSAGNASYNSLQASLTKRVGETRLGTVYYTLAYTLGHSIDNVSGNSNRTQAMPAYATNALRASSDFDLRNNISLSGGWDLPFDRMWSTGPKRLTNGWSLYPILSWRTGFPIDINATYPSLGQNDPGPSGAGDPGYVNALLNPGVGGVAITSPSGTNLQYFDPTAFLAPGAANYQFTSATPCSQQEGQREFPSANCVLSDPAVRTYGGGRNYLRGPGRINLDLSLAKTTTITERLSAELRLEAFNTFNHAQWGAPDTSITDPRFGRITYDYGPRIVQLALRFIF